MSNNQITSQQRLDLANRAMERLYEQINLLSLPSFGSDMLHSNTCVASITVASRVLSKYERPNNELEQHLKSECRTDWIAYEDRLRQFSLGNYASGYADSIGRRVVWKARLHLHNWFRDFKPSFNDVEIPTGSTFEKAWLEGATSVIEKLSYRKYWTVTPDASDDFIRLCYNTLWLKRAAKAFFKRLSAREYADLHWEHLDAPHVGFAIFRTRMLNEVLTFVKGSRGSSVPKNNRKRRFINIEPLGNMILQRCVATSIRAKLVELGNDLEIGQDIHKQRISDKSLATIDFSNASDSVIWRWVQLLFPKNIVKYLGRYRSEMCYLDGTWHWVTKLSSMGNGFTFEVMTALLLAIGRVLDDTATVYGDDVIIHNMVADQFVDATESIGFSVNTKKTFIRSSFRESCGAFYSDDVVNGYIVSYDFHFIEHEADFITTANKLHNIIRAEQVSSELLCYLLEAYEVFLSLSPTLYKGPVMSEVMLTPWIQTANYLRKHKRDDSVTAIYQDVMGKIDDSYGHTPRLLQWRRSNVDPNRMVYVEYTHMRKQVESPSQKYYKDWVPILVPLFVSDLNTKTPKVVHKPGRAAAYFYAMRETKDTLRDKGTWSTKLYLVSPWGTAVKVSDLCISKRRKAPLKKVT